MSLFAGNAPEFANEPADLEKFRCRYSKIGNETPHLQDPFEAPNSPSGSPTLLWGCPVLRSDIWHRHGYRMLDGSFLENFDVF